MNKISIILKIGRSDYFYRKHRIECIRTWLTERKIPHTFMLLDSYEPEIPHVVILHSSDVDATAFKLRFEL